MDDRPCPDRRDLYSRVASITEITGLFTRPPHMALADETSHGRPVLALNQACDKLRTGSQSDGVKVSIVAVARDAGFEDITQFINLFYEATGWNPEDWQERFGPRFL